MAKKYSKRSLNKDYELDLTKYDFGSFLKTKQGVGAAGAAGMAGSLISGLSNGDPTAGAIGGALSGAASGAALGPLGMAGGAIIGGATSLLQANAAKEAEKQAKYQEQVAQSMQADQNYKSQLQNQQANIPTFSIGGELKQYVIGGDIVKDPSLINTLTTIKPDIMSNNRQTILKGGIDNPELYQDQDAPNKYFTALQGDSIGKPNAYTQRFITNYNNIWAPKTGDSYDPNAANLHMNPDKSWKNIPANAVDTVGNFKPLDWKNPQKYNIQSNSQGRALGSGALGIKANGGYTIDYKGASHAQGGIPVNGTTGNPIQGTGEQPQAEVEGNEIAAKFPGENTPYIFSHKLGFADKARKIEKKYSKRPNEKMSQDAKFMELGGLMKHQEEVRGSLDNHMGDVTYSEGGKIHINPANKGKFTTSAQHAGMGTQEFARHVLAHKDNYSTTQIKRASFAHNAAGWKHEDGGELEDNQYKCGGRLAKYDGFNISQYLNSNPDNTFKTTQNTDEPNLSMQDLVAGSNGITQPTLGATNINASNYTLPQISTNPSTQSQQDDLYRGSNLPLYMGAGTALANLGLAATVKNPKDINPITINPGKIDSNPMRRDILENAGRSRANRLAALRASGLSQAQYISAVSAGDSDINQSTGNLIRQNEMDVQGKNIAMNQSAQETNAKAINEANLYNAQQKYGAQQQRRSYITNALQNVGQGVQSYMNQREILDATNIMSPYMELVTDKYGRPKKKVKPGI